MDAIKLLEQANVKVYKSVKETGRQLGVGSFGSVVELKIKGEGGKFAGKKIHEVLVVDGDVTVLVKECKLMSELIHPNIAKFCGVCKLPRSTTPALVMELMDHSLEEVIENTTATFRLTLMTTLSIFIDIANGLAYLHGRTPQVLHRDLTARNVLLDKLMRAKITDFGNSRIVDATRVSKTMTQAPGTQVYMPPEALDAHAKYSDRLDIFSFGHLALYTLIREFPKDILPATHIAPEGHLTARSEVERRSHYMEKLNTTLPVPDHHMFQLIKQCLRNDSTKRPSSIDLLHWLQQILGMERGEFSDSGKMKKSKSDLSLYRHSIAGLDYEGIELYTEMQAVPGNKKAERITALRQMEADINQHSSVQNEGKAKCSKTGLIEKWSGGMKRGWKAYSYTLDYKNRTFQYSRVGPFARSHSIHLEEIADVTELEVEGNRFPFMIYFSGKQSPWEFSVYSQADRTDWKEALLLPPSKMQGNISYGQIGEDDTKEELVYDTIPDAAERYTPQPQRNRIEPVYEESSTLKGDTDGEEEDDVYEKIIGVLQGKFNPTQMDVFTKRLHNVSVKKKPAGKRVSFQQESFVFGEEHQHTPEEIPPPPPPVVEKPSPLAEVLPRGALEAEKPPLSLPPPPPPLAPPPPPPVYTEPTPLPSFPPLAPPQPPVEYTDPQPPLHTYANLPPPPPPPQPKNFSLPVPAVPMVPPPPPLDTPPPLAAEGYTLPFSATLDMNIYPEVDDYDSNEEDAEYTDTYSYIPDPEPEKIQKATPPPPPPKPSKPSKQRRGFKLKKRVDIREVGADEELLITEDTQRAKRRPTWAVAKQAPPTPPPTPSDLEDLRKEALSISLSSLSDITLIGEGNFGEVYSAQMKDTTRQCKLNVAIKVTKAYSSKKVMQDFQNEMNTMSQVCHNNIVRLYGIISEGPLSPALVMEYLPHGNLQTYLIRKKQPEEFLLKCMIDVAMGMHYLCERGLIHRDLAARNVLVDKDKHCKISDFGLLREVPKDNSIYISQSRGPSPVRWMAPESINERTFSPASDVWSYGILQWEMFFPDKIPYPEMEDMQIGLKVSSGYRMPIPRGCPRLAGQIMRACWQHDPRDRPSFLLISNLLTSLPV